jgi:hypothetical protein
MTRKPAVIRHRILALLGLFVAGPTDNAKYFIGKREIYWCQSLSGRGWVERLGASWLLSQPPRTKKPPRPAPGGLLDHLLMTFLARHYENAK